MSTVTYGAVKELYALNGKKRIAYGMVAYSNAEIDGTATIIASARDLTSDKKRIKSFVDKCNKTKLLPINFDDAIEDFLAK